MVAPEPAPKPRADEWRYGRWAGWVMEGEDRTERLARLEQVPEGMRDYTESLVVRAYKARAARKRIRGGIRNGS